MAKPEDLVIAHLGASPSEAEIVRGILEGAGIFALIADKNSPLPALDLTPFDGDYRRSGCEVLVAARDLEAARKLLDESRAAGALPEEETPPPGSEGGEGA